MTVDTPPRSRLRILRVFISIVLILAITAAMLEMLLAFTDPLGLRYVTELGFIKQFFVDAPAGFHLAPGKYVLGNWQATVHNDFTRLVPDNPGGTCRLVFLGDSVTFGWGVNDELTFSNQMARELEGVDVVNAGTIGYTSQNVRWLADSIDFDAAVYLIINNDHQHLEPFGGNTPSYGVHHQKAFGLIGGGESALLSYALYITLTRLDFKEPATREAGYFDDIAHIASRNHLLLFAYDEPLGRRTAAQYPVTIIPHYTTSISRSDPHPDAQGHQHTAQSMLPAVRQLIESACDDRR